jgi:hypothetical protein
MNVIRAVTVSLAAGLCCGPAIASTRDSFAGVTITGPINQVDHQVTTDITISANAAEAGDHVHGEASATSGLKFVKCFAHAAASEGGGISYVSAQGTTVDRIQLLSQQLQPGEVATVFFGVAFSGFIGGTATGADNTWFTADVTGDASVGDGDASIYGFVGSPAGVPNTPPESGTLESSATWQNAQFQDLRMTLTVDADCYADVNHTGNSSTAHSDYAHTVLWAGVTRVVNSAGVEITDYTFVDEAGNDWRTPGVEPSCCRADFNGDGDIGTDADIAAFFACLGGDCCATCGSADFNCDGDIGTDADIASFFRVLAGGSC